MFNPWNPIRVFVLPLMAVSILHGQIGPADRPKVDDEAARRGSQIFERQCASCHGSLGKGTAEGPDLIRSPLVFHDRLGNELGAALTRLAGHHPAGLSLAQVRDISQFLKLRIEETAKNRYPTRPPNVLTGNQEAGKAYFNGQGGCAGCHSVSGDLAKIGSKYKDPVDLEQRFLFPRQTKPIQAVVTPAGQPAVTGQLLKIDDFDVSIRAGGQEYSWPRTAKLRVELNDPLEAHHRMLAIYTDGDIHSVVRYLESLK